MHPNYEPSILESQAFQVHENKYANKINPQSIGGLINPFEQITNRVQTGISSHEKIKNQPYVI